MRVAAVLLACGVGLSACGEPQPVSKRRDFETEMDVKAALPTAIEIFKLELKRLPPMTTAELREFPSWSGLAVPGNTTNESIECLVIALRHRDLSRGPPELPGSQPFGNTDGDTWSAVPDGSDAPDAKEILDAYGNPLVYITAKHYGETLRVVRGDGKTVDVRAVKKPGGAFYNASSFQIISLGADGKQDQGDRVDDIENFNRGGK